MNDYLVQATKSANQIITRDGIWDIFNVRQIALVRAMIVQGYLEGSRDRVSEARDEIKAALAQAEFARDMNAEVAAARATS